MTYVLRLFRGVEEDTSRDWFPSVRYDADDIKGIEDYSSSAKLQLTSIPSPFARLDLVRTAFALAANNLRGTTLFHKMVSESLDVAEMFFNFDNLEKGPRGAKIHIWDKANDLEVDLLNSENGKLRHLGETLQLFLHQDAAAYNFGKLNRLFIMEYGMQIMGGTSPATLFFSSPDEKSNLDIVLGGRRLFGDQYASLYERGEDFQKFYYSLLEVDVQIKDLFEVVNRYLEQNRKALKKHNNELYGEIFSQVLGNREYYGKNFAPFFAEGTSEGVGEIPRTEIEIIGRPLRKRLPMDKMVEKTSGFVIHSKKYGKTGLQLPLVLQNDFPGNLTYINKPWNPETKVPWVDPEKDFTKRRLPDESVMYPYLGVDDFLEEVLIAVPYPINGKDFYNGLGGTIDDEKEGYLIPVKELYFRFFDISDLIDNFELTPLAGGVKVELRVHINGGSDYVTLKRIYYRGRDKNDTDRGSDTVSTPRSERNQGAIPTPHPELNQGVVFNDAYIAVVVYPSLSTNRNISHGRILLLDADYRPFLKGSRWTLKLIKADGPSYIEFKTEQIRVRNPKGNDLTALTTYTLDELKNGFDCIELTLINSIPGLHNMRGLIIPTFNRTIAQHTADRCRFAIDVGTTNTYLECKIGNDRSESFKIEEKELQNCCLFPISTHHIPDLQQAINQFHVPHLIGDERNEGDYVIGDNSNVFSFPIRTTVSCNTAVNNMNPTSPLADYNIPFIYERARTWEGHQIATNLKWEDHGEQNLQIRARIENYFGTLLLLVRNKVLLNGYDLANTEIICFFPSSMMKARFAALKKIWSDLCEKYIHKECKPRFISESIAPFYYYDSEKDLSTVGSAVSIDIGGGSTDVVIFVDRSPRILTSFRFAANSLFGYRKKESFNAFIRKYGDSIRDALKANKKRELEKVFEQHLKMPGTSEDMIAFFFSLERNPSTKGIQSLSFTDMLATNAKFKILFIVFYAAIIYHIAKLIHAEAQSGARGSKETKEFEQELGQAPTNLMFSGNGSKILNIIDQSSDKQQLSQLTQHIFRHVFGNAPERLVFAQVENPKRVTAQGGIYADTGLDANVESLKRVLIGSKEHPTTQTITYEQIQKDNDRIYSGIAAEIKDFFDMLFSIHQRFNFSDNFSADQNVLSYARKQLEQQIEDSLKRNLLLKTQETGFSSKENVEETLFFYPIARSLEKLADTILTRKPDQDS